MFLTPDKIITLTVGGKTLTVKQKIIPDSLRATKHVANWVKCGQPMKPCCAVGTAGKPLAICVHNTGDIKVAAGTNAAEQYSRATFNGNMRGVVVHFYIWKEEIWQLLRLDERGWHAGDGSTRKRIARSGKTLNGNRDTISIEAIGLHEKTTETTAILCAWLCREYKLDPSADVYQHWDFSGKNCPIYIRPRWAEFISAVNSYLGCKATAPSAAPAVEKPAVAPKSSITAAQQDFIDRVGRMARAAGSDILPSLTIAQAILESGWGKSKLAQKANALFGIKAHSGWKGPRVDIKTYEFVDETRVDTTAAFRAYASWDESVADHDALLRGTRYKALQGERDYKKACHAVHAAGYATAPDYADKLIRLIEQYKLAQWEGKQESGEHVVKAGDTLWSLAVKYLGNGQRWTEIQKANGGPEKCDPNKLKIGRVLTLPAREGDA